LLVFGLHRNVVISFYDLKASPWSAESPLVTIEAYIFEPFTELLLKKVGIFLENDKDERM